VAALQQAMARGEWVCLKNLHLVTPWLPELEKLLNRTTSSTAAPAVSGQLPSPAAMRADDQDSADVVRGGGKGRCSSAARSYCGTTIPGE